MGSFAVTALLLTALVVPVVLYVLLRSRFRVSDLLAAAIAVVIGWALNVAWAYAASRGPSQGDEDFVSIAAYFGWACPTVLVFLTWLVWRLVAQRSR